jgi:hypothetical protein
METVRIRDPGWKKVGSGIRDKHPGSVHGTWYMVHKILHGKGDLKAVTWFEMAGHGVRATRAGPDPLNIRVKHGRLDMRRNFFSLHVIDSWNQIPSEMKRIVKCENFRAAYKTLRAAQLRRA